MRWYYRRRRRPLWADRAQCREHLLSGDEAVRPHLRSSPMETLRPQRKRRASSPRNGAHFVTAETQVDDACENWIAADRAFHRCATEEKTFWNHIMEHVLRFVVWC